MANGEGWMRITPGELGRCFDAYAAGLVLYARQRAQSGLAEDLVQEAFVRLAAQAEAPRNVRGWLLVTVRNAALDAAKRERRRAARDAGLCEATSFQSRADANGWLDGAEVQAALAELPALQREVVVLRIWNGANFQEIAELMRMPVSTVYGHYRTALETLRKKWGALCK